MFHGQPENLQAHGDIELWRMVGVDCCEHQTTLLKKGKEVGVVRYYLVCTVVRFLDVERRTLPRAISFN